MLAADVLISEIMYHPESNNSAHEFIEVHNRGDQAADLTGWKVSNGVDFSFPSLSVPADGYLVIAADVAEFQLLHGMAATVVGGWTGRLANRGETISIVDATGNQIDSVRYADEGEWSTRILDEPDAGLQVGNGIPHMTVTGAHSN